MVRTSVPIPANQTDTRQGPAHGHANKKDGVVRSSLELVFSCAYPRRQNFLRPPRLFLSPNISPPRQQR